MTSKKQYAQLVKCIAEKNFSGAHKYLQAIVEAKVRTRIRLASKQPLFK